MKVKALANLSTAQGRRKVGEEFIVNAAEGQALIERRLVQPVADAEVPADEAPASKPAKTKAAAKE